MPPASYLDTLCLVFSSPVKLNISSVIRNLAHSSCAWRSAPFPCPLPLHIVTHLCQDSPSYSSSSISFSWLPPPFWTSQACVTDLSQKFYQCRVFLWQYVSHSISTVFGYLLLMCICVRENVYMRQERDRDREYMSAVGHRKQKVQLYWSQRYSLEPTSMGTGNWTWMLWRSSKVL